MLVRFFFYVEDDWELLDNFALSEDMARSFTNPACDFRNEVGAQDVSRLHCKENLFKKILEGSILILESNTHIDEVLLNTQWDRNCSLGYVLDSDTKFLNVGGWHRYASNRSGSLNANRFPFSLHEFGIPPVAIGRRNTSAQNDNRRHDFSYWPGFSLNPGLWDVPRIADKFRAICSQRKEFNADIGFTGDPSQMSPWCNFFSESDSAFEHHFSILGHLNGVHVAHLHAVLFKHIGHEVSAYKLNGFRRPWE